MRPRPRVRRLTLGCGPYIPTGFVHVAVPTPHPPSPSPPLPSLLLHRPLQPCLRDHPITLDGHRRDVERAGSLVDRKAAEVSTLHHTHRTLVDLVESFERLIERNEFISS